ncbi:MAG: hypothetical protein JXA22_08980 [Candidatus Thermoplasmatota archaeon]|nr:hypothetical protein [Candidatus Thermoplasmatota archaeon]
MNNATEEVSGADPTIDGTIGPTEYEDSINIDEGKFELFWTTTGSTIFIGMRAEATGWLCLGLDPVNIMTNSDMIFGGVDAGTPYIYDAWCTNDVGNHPEDTTFSGGTFDIDEYDATEVSGTTTVEFKRAMSTGDPYDKKFVNGTKMKVMWATHKDSDDWTDEHDDAEYTTITLDGTPPPPPPVSDEFDGVITDGEYSNSTTFDGGNFQLFWKVNETNITIGMKVLATGWVSLGISPTSMMLGADFLMGGYEGSRAYAEDHYATTTTSHVLDTDLASGTNDIDAFNATESGGWTHFEMRRALVTGDPNDKDIMIGTMNIIWGYSTSDDLAAKHTKVGYDTWRVDAAPPPPPPPPPSNELDGVINETEYGNMTKFDIDRFELHWRINGSVVYVGMRAETTGYISIGIDPTEMMKDADMIFGGFSTGSSYAEDHYATGTTGPHLRDEDLGGTFDLLAYNATEDSGWTTFEFKRNLTTPDTYDRTIPSDGEVTLIWAVGPTDDVTATHSRRGTAIWNLSMSEPPPPPPPPPPHESDLDGIITAGEYTNSTKFDSDRFELHWNVSGDMIFVAMKAEATGYISIGIDPTSQMAQADMILGWVDGDRIAHVQDMFSTGALGPHPLDTAQGGTDDILDYNGTEYGGWTTIEFKRNLSTEDTKDRNISTTGLMTLIWALSDSDDPSAAHTRRGTTTWMIRSSGGEEPEPEPTGEMDGMIAANEYDDSQTFGGGMFEVYWKIFNNSIDLGLRAQTTGWLSIGFEPSRYMKDADMLFGWVDGSGIPHVLDTFSTGDYGPHPPDTQLGGTSDVSSYNGTESGGWTTIELKRALSTGDTYDKDIPTEGSINIIWGTGSTDNYEDTHTDRGSGTLLLYMDEPVPNQDLDGIVTAGEYEDSATFDFENFRVHWTIIGDSIDMAIVAATTGWISIGFDPEDQMNNSDVILGWVEDDGKVNVLDAFSTGPLGPHPPDTHLGGTKDLIAYNGTEIDGHTTIEFTRKLATGDAYDKDIPTAGTMKIMWAFGETDDFSDSHSKRGIGTLTMGPEIPDDDDDDISGDLDGIITDGEYDFNGTFGDGIVELHWKVHEDKIYFAMVGKTTGWVSIGIDHSTAMADSDMIFGWVEDDGTVMVVDAYSTGPIGPHPADSDQGGTNDILDFGGKEINGVSTIEFVRKLVTGDRYDNPIPTNGTPLKMIWATSASDDFNAKHDKVGYGTINIGSGETTSEDVVKLWPIHAMFMTLGVGGMVLATIVLYRRKWKSFFKFHMWVMTAAVIFAVAGTVLGVIMVENSTGVHLRVPHSWVGPLTLLVSLFALGVGFYFKYTKNMKHKKPSRNIHKYVGWTGAVLFVLTTISGFLQALVQAKETAPVWFIIVEALILTLLVGTGIYVVLMGRKKPPVKPSTPSPPPPPPVEEKKEPDEGPSLIENEPPLTGPPEMDEE